VAATLPDADAVLQRALSDLPSLLALEKQRRGVAPGQVVFVGVHNVAQYCWCAMQSVLKCRERELLFFHSHLVDRVAAARSLGHEFTDPAPRTLLDFGRDIEWSSLPLRKPAEALSADGVRDEDLEFMSEIAPRDPLERGDFAEGRYAERLPSIRWSFPHGPYMLVGIPDGLGDDFVYEFKSSKSAYFWMFHKPVARVQADIYGLCFEKARKRVGFHIFDTNRDGLIEEPVDLANARTLLAKFERLDHGGDGVPPRAWKCKSCEYKGRCAWSQA
jgi:hypothetical protein